MSSAVYEAYPRAGRRERIAYELRVLRVIAAIEFKLKYAESVLGYVWSIAKPLSYFAVLWLVFGRFFRISAGIENYPLYLLIGIVLYTFLVDSTGLTFPSLVKGATIIRKLAFPPILIPISVTLTAAMTFLINLMAVAAFVAVSRERPELDWLLIPLLLLEFYVFLLGVGLVLATLFVRFRDIAQIWELGVQLLIFASPIIYPITILPEWAQKVAYLNPLVQVMQDVRVLMLETPAPTDRVSGVLAGAGGRLVPVAVTLVLLAVGIAVFRRDSPRFPERV